MRKHSLYQMALLDIQQLVGGCPLCMLTPLQSAVCLNLTAKAKPFSVGALLEQFWCFFELKINVMYFFMNQGTVTSKSNKFSSLLIGVSNFSLSELKN